MRESALGSDQKMEGWMAFKRYGVGWVAYRVDRAYSAVAFVLRVALLARWTAKCSRRMQHLASDQAVARPACNLSPMPEPRAASGAPRPPEPGRQAASHTGARGCVFKHCASSPVADTCSPIVELRIREI